MARPSTYLGCLSKISARSWLIPAFAGVSILGLLAAYVFVLSPVQGAAQTNSRSTASVMDDRAHHAHDTDAHQRASKSVDEPEDNRFQVHVHQAAPLGEQAYKNAPADVVLWGDLARALVVRKGSTYQTTFLAPVLALDGKTISIVGHVTAVMGKDKPTKQFLLSSNAFLCDGCEPPTPTEVVEVNTKDFVMSRDGVATVSGRFEIVKNDPNGLAYRLNNAVILKQDSR